MIISSFILGYEAWAISSYINGLDIITNVVG